MVDTNLLARYASVKQQLKQLKEEEEACKQQILQEMEQDQLQTLVEPNVGTFSVSKGRPKWTYTQPTQEAIEKLKIKQLKEQESGKATVEYSSPFLVFNTIKTK